MGVTQYGKPAIIRKRVYYTGSDSLELGQPLCYDHDSATNPLGETVAVTAKNGARGLMVEKPATTTNNYAFAGVTLVAVTGPCWLDIAEPGSKGVDVWTNQSCTVSTTGINRITVVAGQYYFGAGGFAGRGSAIIRQTVNRSETNGTVQADLEDGEESGLSEVIDATLAAAGGAITVMIGGVTHFPAATVATNATVTLADGTFDGQKKKFMCDGTLVTSDLVVTITTPSLIAAVATSGYDVITMDAAGEAWSGQWMGAGLGWFGCGVSAG